MNTFYCVYANPNYERKNHIIKQNRGKKTYLKIAMITVDEDDKH